MKNKESSASKIVLDSYESLFGGQEDTGKEDRVRLIPLSQLHEFAGHPSRVLDDEKMQETVESVKKYGILVPGIARKRPQNSGGGYEIISGHRRRRACELAGLTEMPMFVRDYSDDEAVVVMVDSNIQREDILPSEKARAYRMKYDALKHQGARGEKNTADMYPDRDVTPVRYAILLEPDEPVPHERHDECIEILQQELKRASNSYSDYFGDNILGMPKLVFLQSQSFQLYREIKMYKTGISENQLKPVHIFTTPELIRFFTGLEEKSF